MTRNIVFCALLTFALAAAADAAIASMEQQYSYLSSMFQAMQTANQNK